jgi:16S rRNA (guanine966-N2)-methyltransferase
VRETLFNWLQNDIQGARCLDLFAGSGALGIEALSRGARYALLIDKDSTVVSQLNQHMETLQASGGEIHRGDALQILASAPGGIPFDITFLDPPFGKGLVAPCISALESNDWLSNNAKIYIEAETDWPSDNLPLNWEILRQQQVGQVTATLVARHPPSPES